MNFQVNALTNLSENETCLPQIFNCNDSTQKQQLQKLIAEKPYIKISDTISSQLRELIKLRQPSKSFLKEELSSAVANYLEKTQPEDYGCWVYYPWNERLVHIVKENEFVELRTNRNKYKITDAERIKLSTKKIGIIGLSVGQSVAVTLAMERDFGELRIADFDELEITNLNRLRSGIYNMGIKKTVLVAREIAEIDPFLKITCFHEGITEENLESFLLENGKLDILIDECDSVDIKIFSRIAAKKHGIPVLMEASDRATIDIERFDLEPERPIIHGFVAHLDISKLRNLKTSEEKIPYMAPIAGVETLSPRMKASALEIGNSIATWPQLASAVALGGGITADVCRRILLDEYHQSGRFFIDIEELLGDPIIKRTVDEEIEPIALADMQFTTKNIVAINSEIVDEAIIRQMVEAASKAPSAGNCQPWKWYFDKKTLWLFHEKLRSQSYGDFQNMTSEMALGAALENLSLKANELNYQADIKLYPDVANKTLIAQISFTKQNSLNENLAQYIGQRHTNRKAGTGASIPIQILNEIEQTISNINGAKFLHVEGKDTLIEMADIIGTAERLRVFIPEGHYDLFERELRWTAAEAAYTKDGIDLATFELSPAQRFGMRLVKDQRVAALLHKWDSGKGLEIMTRKNVLTASSIGLITMPAFSAENRILAGRALERIWLTAEKNQLALQPMLAPVIHFCRILFEKNNSEMPKDIENEFLNLHRRFAHVFNLDEQKQVGLFLFRLGFADKPDVNSYRLDMEQIFYTRHQ